MAIRFQCGACGQPIEVDDQWAGKVVACPYCRKTVSAPVQSTIDDVSAIPTATAISGLEALDVGSHHGQLSPLDDRNLLAVVAAALATVLVLLLIGGVVVDLVYEAEISEYMDAVTPAMSEDLDFGASMKAAQDYFHATGGIPTWGILWCLIVLAFAMVWVATIVCGIVALRRRTKKPLSVAALIVAGITPLLSCCL